MHCTVGVLDASVAHPAAALITNTAFNQSDKHMFWQLYSDCHMEKEWVTFGQNVWV